MHRLLPFLLLAGAPALAAAADISGIWVIEDKSATVAIARCGDSMCGNIERPLRNQPGHARTDVHNPNPKLRNRPIIGLRILSGFRLVDGRWKGGRIYDPESGRTYRSELRLQGDGSLKVSGCVAFICRSQRWTRQK